MNTLDRFRGLKVNKEPDTDWSRSPNGNKYLTVCVGGIVQEGDEIGHWSMSKEDIIYAFNRDFDKIAAENRGKKIVWRLLPEVMDMKYYRDMTFSRPGYDVYFEAVTLYQVRARFVYE